MTHSNAPAVAPERAPRLAGLGLDPVTESAYHVLLQHPSCSPSDLAGHLAVADEAAQRVVRGLQELELVQVSADGSRLRAVNPQLGLTALAARREAELAERHRELEQGRQAISDLVAGLSGPNMLRDGRISDICWGAREVTACVARLAGAATTEVTAMSTSTAAHADESVIPFPGVDGVSYRLAFPDARMPERGYARLLHTLADEGAKVRVGQVPMSALIIDAATVVLPVSDRTAGQTVGVATLRLPSAVTALVELFERVWGEAVPLNQPAADDTVPGPRERELLALLLAGTTDESAASRLGVSVRTVRRMVSDLMTRLGARSRFQAGARAAERGWLRPPLEGN